MKTARLVDLHVAVRRPTRCRASGLWPVLLASASMAMLSIGSAAAAPPLPRDTGSAIEQQSRALSQAHAAVVGVRATALADARSSRTLGPVRQGSGVQIAEGGLVLTIGYLILEADHVELLLGEGREVPARVVAYDVATGFGLVQALAPLRRPVAPLGSARAVDPAEPMVVASGGDDAEVGVARVVSTRAFSGYWEYHLDSALFTSPARSDHSGAALINGRGEVVGVGSLLVADAFGGDHPPVPGNLFVPIDLLKPILGELQTHGASTASHRAWLGVSCIERDGAISVTRVNEDSPAELAGLQAGDRIVRIDGAEVRDLASLWKHLWRGESSEREVQLEVERPAGPQTLRVHAVDRMMTLSRPQGI